MPDTDTATEMNENDLMAAAMQADGAPTSAASSPAPPAPKPATPAPASATPPAQTDATPTATTAKPATPAPAAPEAAPQPARDGETAPEDEPQPGDSPYTKAGKDKRRFDRNWKKLNEDRKAFEDEKRKWQADHPATTAAPSPPAHGAPETAPQPAARGTSPTEATGAPDISRLDPMARRYNATELRQLAKDLRSKGEDDTADQADRLAGQREQFDRAQAEWDAGEAQRQRHAQHVQAWVADMAAQMEAEPALRDRSTPLSQGVTAVIGEFPFLKALPNGPTLAVGVARLRIEAGEAAGLKTKNQELEKENARLRGLITPNLDPAASAAGTPPGSGEPTESDLERAAREADGMT